MFAQGHFEKGKWVPGELERLNHALIEWGKLMEQSRRQWDSELIRGVFNNAGYFKEGKWIPLLNRPGD